jgi:ataxia telangiectasia mutated family protein
MLTSTVLIRSSKASDRGNGLKQLIRILDLNRGTPGLESLKNKSYQALCDDLFQCMRDERASFLKKPKTAKLSPPFQLSATALRSVVNAGLHVFKVGTAESIIQTIIEVLPGKDGALIAPLLGELPKALRALLEYSPHVERLSKDCWDAAVDFCIESLSRLLADLGADVQTSFSTRASPRDRSRTRTPFDNTDVPTPKSSGRDLPLRQPIPEAFLHPVEDFIHCLHSLTKVANTPILDKAEDILALLVQFLQRKTSRSHATALAIVNAVLSRISLHSVQLTKRTIQELLPLMKSLWADPLLRE